MAVLGCRSLVLDNNYNYKMSGQVIATVRSENEIYSFHHLSWPLLHTWNRNLCKTLFFISVYYVQYVLNYLCIYMYVAMCNWSMDCPVQSSQRYFGAGQSMDCAKSILGAWHVYCENRLPNIVLVVEAQTPVKCKHKNKLTVLLKLKAGRLIGIK